MIISKFFTVNAAKSENIQNWYYAKETPDIKYIGALIFKIRIKTILYMTYLYTTFKFEQKNNFINLSLLVHHPAGIYKHKVDAKVLETILGKSLKCYYSLLNPLLLVCIL